MPKSAMGYRKYHGPVTTLQEAVNAGITFRLACPSCENVTMMYAWTILQGRKGKDVDLGKAVPGFRCKWCKRRVSVVLKGPSHSV